MTRINPKQAAIFVIVLTVIAVFINANFRSRQEKLSTQIAEMTQVVSQKETPLVSKENLPPWIGFSTEARQVIAADIAQQDEAMFGKMFIVQCLSASQTPRKFAGYGVNSDVVVVTARFSLSTSTNTSWKWTKSYAVSETIDSGQFQGLTSSDTIQRIVGTLKEQIQKDNESVSALRKASMP
jgi:hypothetical protein